MGKTPASRRLIPREQVVITCSFCRYWERFNLSPGVCQNRLRVGYTSQTAGWFSCDYGRGGEKDV